LGKATRLSPETIDARLHGLRSQIVRVPEAVRMWSDPAVPSELREWDRMAFPYEWDAVVDRFESLAAAYQRQRLSDQQAALFREIVALMRATIPMVRDLGVREPRTELLEQLTRGLSVPA
jgi:hypothetical protein